MTVDTKAKLIGKVSHEEIEAFLEKFTGSEVTNTVTREERNLIDYRNEIVFLGDKENCVIKQDLGFIHFTYKEEKRSMWYFYADGLWVDADKTRACIENRTPELIGETTELSLGFNDTAIEIMTALVEHFGGYIDENDCDDVWYKRV